MRIVVATSLELEDRHREAIHECGEVSLLEAPSRPGSYPSRERLAEVLADAEVWFGPPLTADQVWGAPRLRWIQAVSAGVEGYLLPGMPSGIALTSAAGAHASQAPAHVFALLLGLAHRLPEFAESQRRHVWEERTPADLAGRSLVVVGMGAIGRQVARLGVAFGMRATGVRRRPEPVPGFADVIGVPDLDRALGGADWLVLACPLTAETRHLIDEGRLGAIARGAGVINVSRGEVIDQLALVRALESGRVGAAGLDVFAEEPLPVDSPLWGMPNVIITPHVAGSHPDYVSGLVPIFADNLRRLRSGQPLRNVVDRDRGY
ncbi:MAG: D-2-hydroxyacid dehydrogenase [Candidatus Dormibacteraceae bacterium]